MEEFSIASMGKKIFAENFGSSNFNCKTNIGLERDGEASISIETHLNSYTIL